MSCLAIEDITCLLSNVWILAYGCYTFFCLCLNIFVLKCHHKPWFWVYWNSRYIKVIYFINWLTHSASTYRGLTKILHWTLCVRLTEVSFRHCLKHWASSVAFPVESNSSRNLLKAVYHESPILLLWSPGSVAASSSATILHMTSDRLACIQQESCQVTLARLSPHLWCFL